MGILDWLSGLNNMLGAATYTRPQDIQAVRQTYIPQPLDQAVGGLLGNPAANDALGLLGGIGTVPPQGFARGLAMADHPNKPGPNDVLVNLPIDQVYHGESALPGGKLTWPGSFDIVRDYASRPTELPPISVIADDDGKNFMIEDGSHRFEAAKLRGQKTIKAYINKNDAPQ